MPKLQHIRSATPDKRPDPTLLADGQLSINTAAATPGVYTKNDAGALIKVGPTFVGSAAPNSSPGGSAGNSVGEHWMDTSVAPPVLRVWDGASWIASQGLTGPQGPAGIDGAAGPQGPAGVDGAAGPQGAPGNDGATGPQGPAGIDGAAGGQGPQGEVGPQGPPGADGAAGAQGPAGADGAAGGQGPQGEVGPQGGQGPQGEVGPQGPPGADGAAGAQGPAGADGLAGAQGPAGPNAVSADSYNISKLGSDGLIYTPDTSGFFSDSTARDIAGLGSSTFSIPPGCKQIIFSFAQCLFSRLNITFGAVPGGYYGNAPYIGGGSGIRHDSPGSWLLVESYTNYTCMGTSTINNIFGNIWVLSGVSTRYEDSHNYFPCGQFDGGGVAVTELVVIHSDAVGGKINVSFAGR